MLLALAIALLPSPPLPDLASGKAGVVVCDEPLAAQAGIDVLRKGGNAVDAAIAVAFALAVVEPTAGNIGGGGFMLVRMSDGRANFIDYRETAPASASRDMYSNNAKQSTEGIRAAGIPGTVAGMHVASTRYGTMPWSQVVEPARRLAQYGFPVSKTQATAWHSSLLAKFPESRAVYQREGDFFAAGDKVRLQDLAATLCRVRDNWRDFYVGETARRIVSDMQRHGGEITLDDLARYQVVERAPLEGSYRGYRILTAPPPSSGGIAMLNMLNILEGMTAPPEPHAMVEAMRLAFADRSELLGDPSFTKVPLSLLISKRYAGERRKLIDPDRATPSEKIKNGVEAPHESVQTTHFSVVDADGNCVSNTYTLNGSFGSGYTAEGTGVLLNNEMDDFAANPGKPNMYGLVQGERNAIQPRKRPLSSMTPTIVLRGGKPVLVLGSPGGPTIINTVTQVLINVVDRGQSIGDAVAAPRMHHQWLPDRLSYEAGISTNDFAALRSKGHIFGVPTSQGIANCIAIDARTGIRTGAADRRYAEAKALAQ